MGGKGAGHHWRFLRAGGFDQARIEDGGDLIALDSLDRKLWVALAMPVAGTDLDPALLDLLDADKDGRIRADDVAGAATWLRTVLRDPAVLVAPGDALPLAAIDESKPEGAVLAGSARHILASLGRAEADTITLEEARDAARIFAATAFNGDGVIPETSTDDEALRALIRDIVATQGAAADRSGAPGVTTDSVAGFYAEVRAACAWLDEGASGTLMPLGEMTAAAAEAATAVADKVEGFLLRQSLAAYSSEAASTVNPPPAAFASLTDKPVAEVLDLLRPLPLAEVGPDAALPLDAGLNPAWKDAIGRFRDLAVIPLLGERSRLSAADWAALNARLAPYRDWQARRPSGAVAGLDPARLRAIAAGDERGRIEALIARDLTLAPQAAAIDDVWRLAVLRCHLLRLANNFVSFGDFYRRGGRAIFQAGTLYLDSRAALLCLRVEDAAKHAVLAALARIFLVYCDCRRADGGHMSIAAAFTAGDSDQLMVGRNGVFYDNRGGEWDATVIRIVEHPISLRQGFFAPYRYAARAIGDQIDKLAQARAKVVQAEMSGLVARAAAPPPAPAPAPAAAPAVPAAPSGIDAARFAGIFAAIGLAVGALGTALASLVTGFLQLAWWQMPVAVVGLLAAISAPSLILAYVKLRQRNLGPLLDASGWAVNARAWINIPFGTSLTLVARLPPGAERGVADPFAERHTPWLRLVLAVALVALALAGWHAWVVHGGRW